jgi:hypothetical protein
MYAVVSLNDEKYQPLADLTWNQNKQQYCERHGYLGLNWTNDFDKTIPGGFERCRLIKELFEKRKDIEWVWWTGCDAMITNHTVKIEDKIISDYDLIIATDCNEINNDSFLIKNTEWSKNWLQEIYDSLPKYRTAMFLEQQAMIDSIPANKEKIKIVPQRYLNAYKNDLYPHQSKYDLLGNDGTWQKGDWLIHWPGTSLDLRIQLARHFINEVVK